PPTVQKGFGVPAGEPRIGVPGCAAPGAVMAWDGHAASAWARSGAVVDGAMATGAAAGAAGSGGGAATAALPPTRRAREPNNTTSWRMRMGGPPVRGCIVSSLFIYSLCMH